MSNPKFAIGETVIRQAPDSNYPELNGEYVILDIVTKEYIENHFGHDLPNWDEIYYELEGFRVRYPDGYIAKWSSERFLRKKYPPSEFTFGELMNNLNKSNQLVK